MKEGWEKIWEDYKGLNFLGRRLKKSQFITLKKILDKLEESSELKIVDVGCGSGHTLNFFRSLGYPNSVGTDFSSNSILVSEKNFGFRSGIDLFVMNAEKMDFEDNSFEMVFSDGMLEHLEGIDRAAGEMARISRKYVLLFQPNQTSIFGRLKNIFFKAGKVSWEKEYSHPENEYVKVFQDKGFRLKDKGSINFREQFWLLFEKVQ